MNLPSANISSRTLWLFLISSVVFAVFLHLKVFTLPNCLAFDSTDDANHTFVNLQQAQRIIKEGQWPLMNPFNNFGTPLLGDQLTLPFSVQSLSYWLMDFPVAATFNRIVISFLTIFVLTLFFHQAFPRFYAIFFAWMAVLTKGFMWHFAHHHYQMALLLFVFGLWAQQCYLKTGSGKHYWLYYLSFIVILGSVNINVGIIIIAMLFLHQCLSLFFCEKEKRRRVFFAFIILLASGIIFYAPEWIYFFKVLMPNIHRAREVYTGGHLNLASNESILLVFLAFLGSWQLYKDKEYFKAARIFVLGVLTTLFIVLLLKWHALWFSLPLLKSTDITRFFWISNIFLVEGFGYFLLSLGRPGGIKQSVSYGCVLLMGLMILYGKINFAWHRVLGYDDFQSCRADKTHYFSSRNSDRFWPPSTSQSLEPLSRIAVDAPSWKGYGIKLNRDDQFSSQGRSVVLNRHLTEYLLKQDLIQIDQSPAAYSFKQPWAFEKLSRLGIKYVVQTGTFSIPEQERGAVARGKDRFVVYQNPVPTGIVYLDRSPKKIIPASHIQIKGNDFYINLPEIDSQQELVITLMDQYGWKAFVDERPEKIFHQDDYMM
ncbi:MAG: hypothetical protein KC618_06750, partial [Candidatus Omnitrophica bacterium]|nr:hypothetical protein [Candidatus Omnitrophota bacterium]